MTAVTFANGNAGVETATLDGDGSPDLVIVSATPSRHPGSISWTVLHGNGDAVRRHEHGHLVAIGDLDEDGRRSRNLGDSTRSFAVAA